MLTIQGKYAEATIYTDNIDQASLSQCIAVLNQPFAEKSKICFMPDVHAGKYAPVGISMTIVDKICPNVIGVDVGCGMEVAVLENTHIELERLDKIIHEYIPAGNAVHKYYSSARNKPLRALYVADKMNLEHAAASMGTLGGGNHFIELGKNEQGRYYLVIHSGSRHLGLELAHHYQNLAFRQQQEKTKEGQALAQILAQEKASNKKIDKAFRKLKILGLSHDMAWLEGDLIHAYLHDMQITQQFATDNRRRMIEILEKKLKLKISDLFGTTHNYIDVSNGILHKGSISARNGERCIIPLNMRDGSLICIGKGNQAWNESAPHGAGRQMSRYETKESISLSQFQKSMEGIYSSTILRSTISESPFAYKSSKEIINHLPETVDIIETIKPVYNFKSGD